MYRNSLSKAIYNLTSTALFEFEYLYTSSYERFPHLARKDQYEYQNKKLSEMLGEARKRPFYSERLSPQVFSESVFIANDEYTEHYQNLGFVKKEDLINAGASLSVNRLFDQTKTTGGSTGEPVVLTKNPGALARERAATWRGYHWAGIEKGDRQLRFWGVPHTDSARKTAVLKDFVANRVRISAFELTEERFAEYHTTLMSDNPDYIYGYVSAIEEFAGYISRKELPVPDSLKAIVTTSEILSDGARQKIEKAFAVKVYNEYGCGEVGSIAHECSEGKLHLSSDNLMVGVLINDKVELYGTGELVVTDLYNTSTPLIKYRTGDFATISRETCSCGNQMPYISNLHGRAYDHLVTPSGVKIHPESIIYVFEKIQEETKSFQQFQVVQETTTDLSVYIRPAEHFSESIEAEIIDGIKSNVCAEFEVNINYVEKIEREGSGKLRLVKSQVRA